MTEKEIDKIASRIIDILDKKDVLNKKRLTPFQKVEKILYNLDVLKGAVETKKRLIEDLKNNPVIIKKGMSEPVQGGLKKYESEIEKIEEKIDKYYEEIKKIQNIIDVVEIALKAVENEKYYRLIELKYFEKRNFEDIAEELGISVITAKRNRNLIIKKWS